MTVTACSDSTRRALCSRLPRHAVLVLVTLATAFAPAPRAQLALDVNAALARASARLLEAQRPDGSFGPLDVDTGTQNGYPMGTTALALYALRKSGVRADDPAVTRALAWLLDQPLRLTYSVGALVLALDAHNEPGFEQPIRDAAAGLEEHFDENSRLWAYPDRDAELSNTQLAVLALRAAVRHGHDAAPQLWSDVIDGALSRQRSDGGFYYREDYWPEPSGTMTTAGLTTLYVAIESLERAGRGGPECKRARDGIERGWAWLDARFGQSGGAMGHAGLIADRYPAYGRSAHHHYYYLYGVERVAAFGGRKLIGGVPWYRATALEILGHESPHGGWGNLENTCLAMLTLRRVTVSGGHRLASTEPAADDEPASERATAGAGAGVGSASGGSEGASAAGAAGERAPDLGTGAAGAGDPGSRSSTDDEAPVVWAYTTDEPRKNWFKQGFDDHSWARGPGGFGGGGPTGLVVRTDWPGSDLWVRRRFDWTSADGDLRLFVIHDDDVQVWINGQLAAVGPTWSQGRYNEYAVGRAALRTLAPGGNVIAAHVHDSGGGRALDIRFAPPADATIHSVHWLASEPQADVPFVQRWELLGPLPDPDHEALLTLALPEALVEGRKLKGKSWQPQRSLGTRLAVDATLHGDMPSIAYARVWLHASAPLDGYLWLGQRRRRARVARRRPAAAAPRARQRPPRRAARAAGLRRRSPRAGVRARTARVAGRAVRAGGGGRRHADPRPGLHARGRGARRTRGGPGPARSVRPRHPGRPPAAGAHHRPALRSRGRPRRAGLRRLPRRRPALDRPRRRQAARPPAPRRRPRRARAAPAVVRASGTAAGARGAAGRPGHGGGVRGRGPRVRGGRRRPRRARPGGGRPTTARHLRRRAALARQLRRGARRRSRQGALQPLLVRGGRLRRARRGAGGRVRRAPRRGARADLPRRADPALTRRPRAPRMMTVARGSPGEPTAMTVRRTDGSRAPSAMQFRPLGRSGIELSVVGFGTCQLRLVPEQQALDTLRRGFELGVNWVHTAPDYGGADELVAAAVTEWRARGGGDVHVLCNASGPVEHFGWVFERTCAMLGRQRLPLFGISGIDYCEELGQNVFGAGGLLEWLERRRDEGRLGGIFCTTHGAPDYLEKLVRCGRFDAVMLSLNPLGFHVLSYHGASEGKAFEVIPETRERIVPLAAERGVGLLVMKPLAGGLLLPSRAFPPHERYSNEPEPLRAADLLRASLAVPGVTAVVPGTATPEEAEENALAGHATPRRSEVGTRNGHGSLALEPERLAAIDRGVSAMQASLCSRCGACEPTCSRDLPVSWLFREAYIWSYPSDTFEALDRLHYFALHPHDGLACTRCDDVSCQCPAGLDIPASLARVHTRMLDLRARGLLHCTADELAARVIHGHVQVGVVWRELPDALPAGASGLCRFWLHNAGDDIWWTRRTRPDEPSLALVVELGGRVVVTRPLLHDVGPEQRVHFSFLLPAPARPGDHALRVSLRALDRRGRLGAETLLDRRTLRALDPRPTIPEPGGR